jgi:hypothetical protein
MAITVTRTIQRIETYPAIEPMDEGVTTHPTIMAVYNITTDDPNDKDLPVTATEVKHFSKGDDISKQDTLIVTIANAIWL